MSCTSHWGCSSRPNPCKGPSRPGEGASRADGRARPPHPGGIVVEQLRKDGSTFWSEVRAGFLRRPDGTPYGVGRHRQGHNRTGTARGEGTGQGRGPGRRRGLQAICRRAQGHHHHRRPRAAPTGHRLQGILQGPAGAPGRARHRGRRQALTEIDVASVRLNNMVADLFELPLIEQGRMSLRRASVSPPYSPAAGGGGDESLQAGRQAEHHIRGRSRSTRWKWTRTGSAGC